MDILLLQLIVRSTKILKIMLCFSLVIPTWYVMEFIQYITFGAIFGPYFVTVIITKNNNHIL